MLKCTYCNSVYYNNETKCTSCGATLPYNKQNNTVNPKINKSSSTPVTNMFVGCFIVIFLIGFFIVLINIVSFSSYDSNSTIIEVSYEEPALEEYVEGYTKFTPEDIDKYEEQNKIFIETPSNKEAVEYLIWYYLYTDEPYKSYDVYNTFLEQSVKDDGEVYIDISYLYIEFELYGYAYYVLDTGYELTKLESVKTFADSFTMDIFFEDTPMGTALPLMFGKELTKITYKDLATIKVIDINKSGETIYFSTTAPMLENGMLKDYDNFKDEMKFITLANIFQEEVNFNIFVNLQVLIDGRGNCINIDSMSKLNNLYYLELFPRSTEIPFEKLPIIPSLKGLSLNGSYVKAIGNIEELKNLEYLKIEDTEIYDITKIGLMTNLTTVSIEDNENLTDLSSLNELSSLKNLEVIDMDILTLNINTDLVKLEKLIVTNTDIRNLDFIASSTHLKDLAILRNSDLISMPNLSALTQLEVLKTQTFKDKNNIRNVDFTQGLTALKVLSVHGAINKISPIDTFTQLEELILDTSVIPDSNNISKLSSLTNLKKLVLNGKPMNNITDLSFVSSLKNLTYLDVQNAGYVKGSGIFNLENLQVLYLGDFVGTFSISNLKLLEELYMSDAGVYDNVYVEGNGFMFSIYTSGKKDLAQYFSQIEQLKNLRNISMSNNQLESVDFMKNLPNLTRVMLSDNYITDLSPLAELENLTYVDVSKNPINNWAGLKEKGTIEIIE